MIDDIKAVTKPSHFWRSDWFLGLLLAAVTFAVYQPSWNGKPVWDDDGHMTSLALRSFSGLAKIWIHPGATQQYYPLVHSVFWLEYHLWGGSTPGYHFLNILLHVFSALLLVKILRRLQVSGAWLIAAIFSLHPVMVESVAWITELKNTLSGVLFFAALLTYLKYDEKRTKKSYAAALCLFVLGLLSKSVIASLPVVLLVLFWWKQGRIEWKRDVLPLLPFFAVGIVSGLFTAWMERNVYGAQGDDFNFSVIERCLIAGRALWFYAGTIFWPADLVFIYPRWQVSAAAEWQYFFPVGVIVIMIAFWAVRNRWRSPLAVFLYFTAMLFPVLGFLNVYPFRFSFVADHFQYIAAIGPITLASGLISRGLGLLREGLGRFLRPAVYGVLLLTLGALTWKQCGMYADAETLYRTTILKNPACWMAQYNLGVLLSSTGRTDEAIACYRKALEVRPGYPEALNNLGNALLKTGQGPEAIACYRMALAIKPGYADANRNLGNVLLQTGQVNEAIVFYRHAVEIDPNDDDSHNYLGIALIQIGQTDEAIGHFQKAIEINPDKIYILQNCAKAYVQKKQPGDAIPFLQRALAVAHAAGQEALAAGITADLEKLYQENRFRNSRTNGPFARP